MSKQILARPTADARNWLSTLKQQQQQQQQNYAQAGMLRASFARLLKSVARAFGFTGEMIDRLLDQGFTTDDIEEILYEGTW